MTTPEIIFAATIVQLPSPPWWQSMLPTIFGTIIGAILVMVANWLNARRAEAIRRESRWESMAEHLWQQRFAYYDGMISALDAIEEAVYSNAVQELQRLVVNAEKAHCRIQAFGGARVGELSATMLRANSDLLKAVSTGGSFDAMSDLHVRAWTIAKVELQSSMRTDLGIGRLSALSDSWFDRKRLEAFDRQWWVRAWQRLLAPDNQQPPARQSDTPEAR